MLALRTAGEPARPSMRAAFVCRNRLGDQMLVANHRSGKLRARHDRATAHAVRSAGRAPYADSV
jgi:hypothetical protein